MFDQPLWRFAASGMLILLYSVADVLARRVRGGSPRPHIAAPRWVRIVIAASVTAFYLLIGPLGGALAGGWGNAAGVGLVLGAVGVRLLVRSDNEAVRHPGTAARMLFYAALPLAVGVPWGWLALTAPAIAVSAYCSLREDRILSLQMGEAYRGLMSRSHRWIPGVW